MSLAAAGLLSAPALTYTPLPAAPPTVTVTVAVAAALSPSLVTRVLNEAGDIWRAAGFILIWDRRPDDTTSHAALRIATTPSWDRALDRTSQSAERAGSSVPATPASGLHLTIGNEPGTLNKKDPSSVPLGWILFEADSPAQEIYLSYANATALLRASEGVTARIATMTVVERDTLLGRAMGRALAHEIGHYLLASKAHASSGIMRARRGSAELFSSSRNGFRLLPEQRRVVSDRLRSSGRVAGLGASNDW